MHSIIEPTTPPALCLHRLAAYQSASDAHRLATMGRDFAATFEARLDADRRWADYVRSLESAAILSESAARAAGLSHYIDIACSVAVPIGGGG